MLLSLGMGHLMRLGALAAIVSGAVACGFAASDSAFGGGTSEDPNAQDAGAFGSPSPSGSSDLGPVDNAIVLVHAAKSAAFRLCFTNDLFRLPLPDLETMPNANVVGVEVGSAVRLPPLKGAPGDVYLFDEPLIRAFYPVGGGPGPDCASLLSSSNDLSKVAVKLGTITKNLSTRVHLLVVKGCPGNGPIDKYTAEECGSDWDPVVGNRAIDEIELKGANRSANGPLPAQIVNLSKQLDNLKGERDLVIRFGDLKAEDALLSTVVSAPPLFGGASPTTPAQLIFPSTDPASYTTYGLRVGFESDGGADAGAMVLDQPLDLIQAQSSPQDLPNTYYAAASNYAFLLLGDPSPTLGDGGPDPDEKHKLHMLAIPVISPSADAGADSVDGGTAEGGNGNADGSTP